MTRTRILITALMLWGAVTASAESTDFAQALAEHRYPLRFENGRLEGDGGRALIDAASAARYVLVGEDHGLAEPSELTEALFRALRPDGFDTYVTEVGPLAARRLRELAEAPRGGRAFAELYARYPFSIPMATYREEAALLATVAELSESDEPIWGIDQEFIFSPRMFFDELARRAEGTVRAEIEALAEAEAEAYRTLVAERNPSVQSFMSRPLPESWPRLRSYFAERGDEEALAVVEELEATREIYGHFFAGQGYLNNYTRSLRMKANLSRYLERHGNGRRLLVKLGANHVMRGMSPMAISDVGNFLAEVAALDGASSLHVLLMATGGTQNRWLPFLPRETLETPIDLRTQGAPFLRPLVDALMPADAWAVYDLRPLRPQTGRWAAESRHLASVVLGFDLVVVIPQARAAEIFATLLPPETTP